MTSNKAPGVTPLSGPAANLDHDIRLPPGTVGILGGLGPLAGAHFYRRLIERTSAQNDSGHLPVILVSDPSIPSRVENLFGKGPSPVPALINLAKLLKKLGASVIAMPSSTTHAFYSDISDATEVKIINLLAEVASVIQKRGSKHPAILATTPTVDLDLYRPYLAPQAAPVYPDRATQDKIHELVFLLKSGMNINQLSELLVELISGDWAKGSDSVVLACTELCLVDTEQLKNSGLNAPIISATDVLADAVIAFNHKS